MVHLKVKLMVYGELYGSRLIYLLN